MSPATGVKTGPNKGDRGYEEAEKELGLEEGRLRGWLIDFKAEGDFPEIDPYSEWVSDRVFQAILEQLEDKRLGR